MNFLEFLVEIRVSKSKELLVDTDKSIAEIAISVGYMDLKHFSKLFKKYAGLTPSEYRKIYQ
ncbi:MAG: helix-turn-helix transcriptional regulator, partial [Clostridiales bacterium]|jgi:two-component system response regulator YesN|nr:helix-turn-helix transcriptional regulator [Clostridiales bacterium]